MNTTTLQSPTFTATPITSVFDEYGTFEPSLYFAVLHELIPSELSISLELKGSWNSYLELVDKLAIH